MNDEDPTPLVALVPTGGEFKLADVQSELNQKAKAFLCIPYLNGFTSELENEKDSKATPPKEYYFNGCNGANSIIIWLIEQRRSDEVYNYIKDWISPYDPSLSECCTKVPKEGINEPDADDIDLRLQDAENMRCGFSTGLCNRFQIQTVTFSDSIEQDAVEFKDNSGVLEDEAQYCVAANDIPRIAGKIETTMSGKDIEALWGSDIDQKIRDRVKMKKVTSDGPECGCCNKNRKWRASQNCDTDFDYGYTPEECQNRVNQPDEEDHIVRTQIIRKKQRYEDIVMNDLKLTSQRSSLSQDAFNFEETMKTVKEDLGNIPVRIYRENAKNLQKFFDTMALFKHFDCKILPFDHPKWQEKADEHEEIRELRSLLVLDTNKWLLDLMSRLIDNKGQCMKIGVCLPVRGFFTDIKTAARQNNKKLPPGTPIVTYSKCGCCKLSGPDHGKIFKPFKEFDEHNSCGKDQAMTKGYVAQSCMRTTIFWKFLQESKPRDKLVTNKKRKNIEQVESAFDVALKSWQSMTPSEEYSAYGYTQHEITEIRDGKMAELWKEGDEFKDAIKKMSED